MTDPQPSQTLICVESAIICEGYNLLVLTDQQHFGQQPTSLLKVSSFADLSQTFFTVLIFDHNYFDP